MKKKIILWTRDTHDKIDPLPKRNCGNSSTQFRSELDFFSQSCFSLQYNFTGPNVDGFEVSLNQNCPAPNQNPIVLPKIEPKQNQMTPLLGLGMVPMKQK